jgi:hypothetical protein
VAHAVLMKTIVKTSTAQDFLALVPDLVGFQPAESIVFVAFRGKRSIGAMRWDLPRDENEKTLKRIATTVVGMLSKLPGVEGVVPVVYTAARATGGGGVPAAAFVETAIARFEFSGIAVKDALYVAGDGWGSYLDEDAGAAARPLAEIRSSSIVDSIPAGRRPPLQSIDDRARLPEVDLATKERVARRIRTLAEVLGWLRREFCSDPAIADALELRGPGPERHSLTDAEIEAVLDAYLLDDVPQFVEMAFQIDPVEMPDRAAAMLIHLAQSPALRDVLMMQWAFDRDTGDRVLDDAGRFRDGADAASLDTATLMLGEGPRPDAPRIEAALPIVKALVARAPRGHRPPLLCILAWLNWALGRSSVAQRFVDDAVAVDPHYGLAEILGEMFGRGMLPEWAFDLRD